MRHRTKDMPCWHSQAKHDDPYETLLTTMSEAAFEKRLRRLAGRRRATFARANA